MRKGDIIIEFNGESVKGASWFTQHVGGLAPNVTINLTVIRKTQRLNFKITLDERPGTIENGQGTNKKDDTAKNNALKEFGINGLSEITSSLRRQYKLNADVKGLIITSVEINSSAAMNGLRAGDVLQEVNGHEVKKLSDLDTAIKKTDKMLILQIERDGGLLWLKLDRE